jgi:hypothetical protein
MYENLIIEENTIYELDEDCLCRKEKEKKTPVSSGKEKEELEKRQKNGGH